MSRLLPNNRLQEARIYLGLWVSEAADAVGMDPHFLEGIEKGKVEVDDDMLARMSRIYQRPVDWLTGERTEALQCAKAFEKQMSRLSEHDRQEVALFMDFLQHRKEVG